MSTRPVRGTLRSRRDSPEPAAASAEAVRPSTTRVTRGRADRRQPTIGIIATALGDEFFGNVIAGLHRAAKHAGGRVIGIQALPQWREVPVAGDARAYVPYARDLVDGYVVVLDAVGRGTLQRLKQSGKPLVSVCAGYEDLGIPAVFPDNRTGMAAIVRHLVDHGHRRIGFVGCLAFEDTRDRFAAYVGALREVGIEPDPGLCFDAPDMNEPGGLAAAEALLATGMTCTAVCAATDQNALGLMARMQDAGYRIPGDLAITGFDDLALNAMAAPALTTVHQDNEALGAEAARLVLTMLAGQHVPSERVFVPSEPVYRQSCGCSSFGVRQRTWQPDSATEGAWATVLRQALAREVCGDAPEAFAKGVRAASAAIDRCIAALEVALHGGPLPLPGELNGACRHLCACAHGVEAANRAIFLLERAVLAVLGAGNHPSNVTDRVNDVLYELRTELLYAARLPFVESMVDAQVSSNQNYHTSLAMLQPGKASVRDLAWLRDTPAVAGCLGLWQHDTPGGELTIAGVYPHDLGSTVQAGACCPPESFPPLDVVERTAPNATLYVPMVLPLQTADRDWGALALLSPVESHTISDAAAVWQWSVLLMAALERELLQSFRVSEERYAVATKGTNDGLWDWDLRDNRVYYSARWKEMAGFADDEVEAVPGSWFELVHPDDRGALERGIAQQIAVGSDRVEYRYRLLHRDGSYRWMLCRGAVVREGSEPVRIAGSQTDISAQQQLETRLAHMAQHDALTGLPNRIAFLDRLEHAMVGADQDAGCASMLSLDLDRFKEVNDTLGHQMGDALLRQVADRLRGSVRASDFVARLGGDEFAIVLPRADGAGAQVVAQQIHAAMQAPFVVEGHPLSIGASVGLAVYPEHGRDAATLLGCADVAMYAAKRGQLGYALYDPSFNGHDRGRHGLASDLRVAVEHGELRLYYQPTTDFASGQVYGVEALVRWQHPHLGLLLPEEFIPLAEQTGVIIPLTKWVLDTALRQWAVWAAKGWHLQVAVNLSICDVRDPDLCATVERLLAQHGVPAQRLTLEVTETVVMADVEGTKASLERLAGMGVRLAIDDFGTGYSSLAYLSVLPLTELKIDRTFVQRMKGHVGDQTIVASTIGLARSLGMDVVTEGVEDGDTYSQLCGLGADSAQGFYLSVPLPAEQLVEWLSRPTVELRPEGS